MAAVRDVAAWRATIAPFGSRIQVPTGPISGGGRSLMLVALYGREGLSGEEGGLHSRVRRLPLGVLHDHAGFVSLG